MLFKTKAIALNYIKYRDTSIIARIYTREFGTQSYVINRIRVKNPKFKIAHFQPFTLLDLVCYHNEKRDIQRISEMRVSDINHRISFDISKSGISLFLTEILIKVLKEEQQDYELFDFIYKSIVHLNEMKQGIGHFHIQFLLKLGKYLGMVSTSANELIKELSYSANYSANEPILQKMMNSDYTDNLLLNKNDRQQILDMVIKLYQYHFDNLKEIRSLVILKEVMS